MSAATPALPPVQGYQDIELGRVSSNGNGAGTLNQTAHRQIDETFDVFRDNVDSVLHELDKIPWKLPKLREELAAAEFPGRDRIRFRDLELFLVKYSHHQGTSMFLFWLQVIGLNTFRERNWGSVSNVFFFVEVTILSRLRGRIPCRV